MEKYKVDYGEFLHFKGIRLSLITLKKVLVMFDSIILKMYLFARKKTKLNESSKFTQFRTVKFRGLSKS